MGLRIVFMGTPEFAVPALQNLHEAGHNIVSVYTRPPQPKGRGQQVQKSPVHLYAEENDIPVFHPKTLKTSEAQLEFAGHRSDVAVVAAYGLILPKTILDAPRHGCINIHASLLPRWRGASPIQHAILSGDAETGITLMQMDEGLDTGAVIALEKVPIDEKTTTPILHNKLAALGGTMIVQAMAQLAKDGALPSVPQGDDYVYAPLLKKEDGRIDWKKPASSADRQIRAFNPWPGAFTSYDGKRIKILAAVANGHFTGGGKEREGKILDREGRILCGDGSILRIVTLQPEGKNRMDFASALNGGYVNVGGVFA